MSTSTLRSRRPHRARHRLVARPRLAIAEGLAAAGARLVLNGVDPPARRLGRRAARQGLHGRRLLPSTSATRPPSSRAFDQLDAAGIEIDILVNNAGVQFRKPMVELPPKTGAA